MRSRGEMLLQERGPILLQIDRKRLTGIAAFLVFVTGPAGALRGFTGTVYFYPARFALIGAGLLLAFIAPGSRRQLYRVARWLPVFVAVYCTAFAANALANPDSRGASALQALGVSLWIVFGILVTQASADRNEALAVVIRACVWAQVTYVALGAWLLVRAPAAQFNEINGRWLGAFIGSTAASETMFAVTALGFMLLSRGRFLTSILLIGVSAIGTFITGVRSSSVVLLGVVALIMVQSMRGGLFRKATAMRIAVVAVLGLVGYFVLSLPEVLTDRFSREVFEGEGRLEIWRFGLEALTPASVLFGVGTRAVFTYGVSSEGIVYDSTIAWHNTWLGLLIETGLIGLLVHIALLWPMMLYSARTLTWWVREPRAEHSTIAIVGALFGLRYVLISATEMNLYTALSPGVMLFGSVLGILGSSRGAQDVLH